MPPAQLRTPFEHPTPHDVDLISLNFKRRVRLRHPGYPDTENLLLNLAAPDSTDGGLHHGTALVACGILTGNKWDGYLSNTANGPRLDIPLTHILSEGDYYFHLPEEPCTTNLTHSPDPPYPIIPTFDEWAFPHNKLPQSWKLLDQEIEAQPMRSSSSTGLTLAVTARDRSCRLTNYYEGTEVAYIIPERDHWWFDRNSMGRYTADGSTSASVNDVGNSLLLRADLHGTFDQHKWVIVPKPLPSGEYQLVFHLISSSPEYACHYHNVPLQPIPGVIKEYLLARFAKTIFHLLHDFLRSRVARYLQRMSVADGAPTYLEGEECAKLVPGYRPRSVGPKKRKGVGGQDISTQDDSMLQETEQFFDHYIKLDGANLRKRQRQRDSEEDKYKDEDGNINAKRQMKSSDLTGTELNSWWRGSCTCPDVPTTPGASIDDSDHLKEYPTGDGFLGQKIAGFWRSIEGSGKSDKMPSRWKEPGLAQRILGGEIRIGRSERGKELSPLAAYRDGIG